MTEPRTNPERNFCFCFDENFVWKTQSKFKCCERAHTNECRSGILALKGLAAHEFCLSLSTDNRQNIILACSGHTTLTDNIAIWFRAFFNNQNTEHCVNEWVSEANERTSERTNERVYESMNWINECVRVFVCAFDQVIVGWVCSYATVLLLLPLLPLLLLLLWLLP